MTEGEAVLAVAGLEKSYGRIQALAGVDFQIREDEFVALLGPNGAGKSTLLQLLTGLFSPDAGSIRVFDSDLRRHPVAALARIGVVFQQPTLDLELSVAANLRFHADLHGLPRAVARPRIAAALARFGLADRAGDRAGDLSGGNRRRIELARALLPAPGLLLMDEATVGLDPASRRDILAHIRAVKAERRLGVLWATHLVDEAEQADRVIVLDRGRVRYDGTPGDLATRAGATNLVGAFLALTEGHPASEGTA